MEYFGFWKKMFFWMFNTQWITHTIQLWNVEEANKFKSLYQQSKWKWIVKWRGNSNRPCLGIVLIFHKFHIICSWKNLNSIRLNCCAYSKLKSIYCRKKFLQWQKIMQTVSLNKWNSAKRKQVITGKTLNHCIKY